MNENYLTSNGGDEQTKTNNSESEVLKIGIRRIVTISIIGSGLIYMMMNQILIESFIVGITFSLLFRMVRLNKLAE